MKKILAILLLIAILVVGCAPKVKVQAPGVDVEVGSDEDANVADIEQDIQEVGDLDAEIDLDDLESLEADLDLI